ncbi:N-acetylneuraminate synthase [Limnochorda pilosa]|uniref:AFP-like domain-containing protein n=1 Tax=Limnochorda pilosa TaxID=1555112 RepID=A0A0K2SMJ3_LIMPI|nr:N-acetylneuraminate synthase [Limnochorda pilosa]BAS28217.1 hypothetical protein LIP_2376 [Limnochorda pilosa]
MGFQISARRIGPGEPVFIIAEAGVNHNGSLDLAHRLVDAAADAGADAVKFQTFRTERMVSSAAPKARYQVTQANREQSQAEMLKSLELNDGAFRELARHAQERGILFLSTPFDEESTDFLATIPVPAYKIGSGDLTNMPLLKHVASRGLPVILSTGMATLGEVEDALEWFRVAGNPPVALLHCTSAYPAPYDALNLRAMETLRQAFGLPTGYSDHSLGIEVPVAVTALGACILEKHLTLDRTLPGPDHAASLQPEDFQEMVNAVRRIESALGSSVKYPHPVEEDVRLAARKSVVLKVSLAAGERIETTHLAVQRPGNGIAPRHIGRVVGMRVARDLPAGTVLAWEDLRPS